jgi:ATP-dependent DNA helicase 2 subunit 2
MNEGNSVSSPETNIQIKNKIILENLVEKCSDNTRIFSAEMALSIYKQFKKKRVYPVTKFRGQLEISPDLSIEVCVYTKTMETRPPSLKKFSLATEFSEILEKGKIESERIYYIYDDPDKNPIQEDLKIKAYFYGKSLVPVGKTEEELFKFNKDEKTLQAIGFTDSYKVPSNI